MGVSVPGWPENTWAIEVNPAPASWDHRMLRVFLGTMARCLPPRTCDGCEFELTSAPGGVMATVTRKGQGEARTYAPLAVSAEVVAALSLVDGRVTGPLELDDATRALAEQIRLHPMG